MQVGASAGTGAAGPGEGAGQMPLPIDGIPHQPELPFPEPIPVEGPPAARMPVSDAVAGVELLKEVAAQARAGERLLDTKDARRAVYEAATDTSGTIVDPYTGTVHRGGSRGNMNIEHVWPKSAGLKKHGTWDLHNLVPTDTFVNSKRDRYAFGDVIRVEFDTKGKFGPRSSQLGDDEHHHTVFEPADEVKGDIARRVLFMATRWGQGQKLEPKYAWDSVELLLEWNRQDPPDDAERAHHERIAKLQGNRNPYVSDPSLADQIGAEAFRAWVGSR